MNTNDLFFSLLNIYQFIINPLNCFLDIYPYDDRPSRCVFMSEIQEKLDGQNWWEMSNLEQVKTMWNHP